MKHLVLFFFTLLPVIHCRKTYQLFAIPAFTLDLSLTSPIQWSTDQSLSTRSQIQESVEAFLFSSFEEYLNEMGSSTTAVNALDSVELDVTIYNKDSLTLTADLIGDVLFLKDKVELLGLDLDQPFMNDMMQSILSSNLQDLLELLQLRISSIESIEYHAKVGYEYDAAPGAGNDPLTTFVSDTNVGGSTSEAIKGGSNAIVASMAVAMTVLAAALFVYVRKDNYRKSGQLLYDYEDNSYSSDDAYFADLKVDEEYRDEEQGIQFIPVPAQIDENVADKKTRATLKEVTPKRYVQPANPFELIYGAAFSHRDAAKVARAHGTKLKKPRSKKVAGKRIPLKHEPLKPMQSISEDHEDGGHETSFIPQFVANFSSFIKENLQQQQQQNGTDSSSDVQTEGEESKKDEMLVYRDFPRHDGTPCVMFTSTDDIEWKTDDDESSPLSPIISPKKEFMLFDQSPKQEEKIDSFVDRLENLMLARSRQYEERMQIEKEMAERKKARLAEKNKQNEECKNLLDGTIEGQCAVDAVTDDQPKEGVLIPLDEDASEETETEEQEVVATDINDDTTGENEMDEVNNVLIQLDEEDLNQDKNEFQKDELLSLQATVTPATSTETEAEINFNESSEEDTEMVETSVEIQGADMKTAEENHEDENSIEHIQKEILNCEDTDIDDVVSLESVASDSAMEKELFSESE